MYRAGGAVLAIAIIFILSFPRFAAQDVGFLRGRINFPPDAIEYADYVNFFRGNVELSEVRAPFIYRPIVPAIASILPISGAQSAISVICILCMCLTVPVLFMIFDSLNINSKKSILGVLLFALSFPVFFCGPIGTIDAVSIFFIALLSLSILKKKWALSAALVFFSILVKETVAVSLFAAAGMLLSDRARGKLPIIALLFGASAIAFIGIRLIIPAGGLSLWNPSIGKFVGNIRFRAIAGLALTLGLPAVLYLFYLLKTNKKSLFSRSERWFFSGGIIGSIILIAVSFFTAHVDARFAWPAVIFMIPPGIKALRFNNNSIKP